MSKDHVLLRLPVVLAQTGLSRAWLYQLVKEGKFPAPIKIGERSVAWVSAEVDDWVQARISASRGGHGK